MAKRSPYERDGVLQTSAAQHRRKKKRRESAPGPSAAENEAWLASMLHPERPTVETESPDTQTTPVASSAATASSFAATPTLEKRPVVQMSVEVLEQKKMLLPYLDKIEYINCQLRQRGLLPDDPPPSRQEERVSTAAAASSGPGSRESQDKTPLSKPPTRALPPPLTRNQDEQDVEPPVASTEVAGASANVLRLSNQVLRSRYPRFYDCIGRRGLVPRVRMANWLLRLVELIYNALADALLLQTEPPSDSSGGYSSSGAVVRSEKRITPAGHMAMPFFTRRFLQHSLGLPELADQESLDLVYNLELRREGFPQVALFASFLRELMDEDALLFFLFVRHELQQELDLNLRAKEKLAHSSAASAAKKYLPAELVELRDHPLVPDGSKQVFLSSVACERVLQRVFEYARPFRGATAVRMASPLILAQYTAREALATRLGATDGRFSASAEEFLGLLVQLFRDVAEDILAQFKYNDDGESLSNLVRLRDAIALDSKVGTWSRRYSEQERVLRGQRIDLMKLQRGNSDNQFRVQICLLENRIRLQEQELRHIQKKISDGESLVNSVWTEVVAAKSPTNRTDKPSALGRRTRRASNASTSPGLVSVLGRFEAHIARLQKQHDIAVKASLLLAVPWQQQMEALRLRMVVRIQRAYRARKKARDTKQQARAKLSEQLRERDLKLQQQKLERKRLEAQRQKGLGRHQERMKAKQEQEASAKKAQEAKQHKLLKKARKEEAAQRRAAREKQLLTHVWRRWQSFLALKRNHRKANRMFLQLTFMKWRRQFVRLKRTARAARAIQRFVRQCWEQRKLRRLLAMRAKRSKLARKYLLKAQARALNRLFNQWAAFTVTQQQVRDNLAAMMQKRTAHWYTRWRSFVALWKDEKEDAARLIQRQYRGRVARQVLRAQRERQRRAVTIQSLYRGRRGRVLAQKRRRIKAVQDQGVETIRRRMQYREAGLCLTMLQRYAYWGRRCKAMARARQSASKRGCVHGWNRFVARRKEKRAALERLRCDSAVAIQRNYRRHYCQRAFRANLLLHRAAVSIQRVFRGFLGRQAVRRLRWELYSTVKLQTAWRRYQAQRMAVSVRTAQILLAAYKGDYSTVKRALGNGFWYVQDAEGNGILHVSAAAGHKRVVKLCLRQAFDVNVVNHRRQTPLHLLLANLPPSLATDESSAELRNGRVALAEYMIEHGAWHEAPDDEGFTPLLLCASLGQSEAVEMLLDHGANTEARTTVGGMNAAQLAVEGSYAATLHVLLDSRSFDTGECGHNTVLLLHTCAGRGLADCVQVLVAHMQQEYSVFSTDVLDVHDSEGYTPLIYAVNNGFVDIVQCLLEAGAGPDVKDFFGRSPLHFALLCEAPTEREAMTKLLIHYEADVNERDTDGDAPLHVSCEEDERLACTLLLLTSGAMLCANALGNHPTHIAARAGAVATLQLLMEYGGDMNLKNYDGKTPLGVARMNKQDAVVQFIAEYFAQDVVGTTVEQEQCDVEASGSIQQEEENQEDELNDSLEREKESPELDEVEQKQRTPGQWADAVTEAYCMGSLAEWTQYVDAETELPFYYCAGVADDVEPVFTWETPVEFDAALGETWEIVRGPTTTVTLPVKEEGSGDERVVSSSPRKAPENAYYLYHNRVTDELTSTIPAVDYALLQDVVQQSKRHKLLRARIRKVSAGELSASAMEYMRFFRGFEAESAQARTELRAAIKLQRHFRARRTRLLVKALLHQNRCAVELQRAFRGRKARREALLLRQKQAEVVRIQAAWRGHVTRQREARGLHTERLEHRRRRQAARTIQCTFRGFVARRCSFRERVVQRLGPKSYFEWEALRQRALVRRSFKVWHEMEAPDAFPKVLFYCHQVTHACSWEKSAPWETHDREAFETRRQVLRWGYTLEMQQAAQSLQKLWRARVARVSFRLILRAVKLMKTCEREYLEDPTHLTKMANYVLYLHTITHDYDRARPLYGRLMRVMAQRGPDLPFVLLSYGIFLHVTQEEDKSLVEEMILRGKLADPTLTKYKVAFLGFFRQAMLQSPEDAESLINYAACIQWLFEQYDEAQSHYLRAIAAAPHRKGVMELFQDLLDRRRRMERAKLSPRSRQTASKSGERDEQFDAFAVFRRWQAQQAKVEDKERRLAFEADQEVAQRLQAASKIQARYRRRNAMRKVTRLKLEYKLAASKAEQAQQQAVYDCVVAAFEAVAAGKKTSSKIKKDATTAVLSLPVSQLGDIFGAMPLTLSDPELRAVTAKFKKSNPKLKHVNVMDVCRFVQAQPAVQERLAIKEDSTQGQTGT